MDEILIGIAMVYMGAVILGIIIGLFLIILRMMFYGRRGGAYTTERL